MKAVASRLWQSTNALVPYELAHEKLLLQWRQVEKPGGLLLCRGEDHFHTGRYVFT